MARARKRHVQLELPRRDKNGQRRGGPRPGAGRPRRSARPTVPHTRRPSFKASEPLQVTIRTVEAASQLRGFDTYKAIGYAILATLIRDNFRIIHISIQGTHIHLLIEAANRDALTRGMRAFQISAAKHLNAAISKRSRRRERRRGAVFSDRYHATIIRTPRHARHELVYVLNNWRKHGESRGSARDWRIDPFSSAPTFDGWRDVDLSRLRPPRELEPYELLPVWKPRTWLLREGWRLFGLLDSTEVPGAHRKKGAQRATVVAQP